MKKFPKKFAAYVQEGDEISMNLGDVTIVAKVYRDDDITPPDQRDDGFWPSLCAERAGYLGPEATYEQYLDAKETAFSVMRAWENNEWWYVGVCVRIWHGDMPLTGEFSNAVWGIDCNYPGSDNSYLWETANDLAEGALAEARRALQKLQSITV